MKTKTLDPYTLLETRTWKLGSVIKYKIARPTSTGEFSGHGLYDVRWCATCFNVSLEALNVTIVRLQRHG